MQYLERFLDRKQRPRTNEALGPKPSETQIVESLRANPEVIDVRKHPLSFYPGFEEYAASWNAYASSESRLALQVRSRHAASNLARLGGPPQNLERDLETLEANRTKQQEFIQNTGITGKEKRRIQRKANRGVRKKREEISALTRVAETVRVRAQEEVRSSKEALNSSDGDFALTLDINGIVFFALERLHDNKGMDELFYKYFRCKDADDFDLKADLTSANYDFLALSSYYNGSERPSVDDLWEKSKEATERQLRRNS